MPHVPLTRVDSPWPTPQKAQTSPPTAPTSMPPPVSVALTSTPHAPAPHLLLPSCLHSAPAFPFFTRSNWFSAPLAPLPVSRCLEALRQDPLSLASPFRLGAQRASDGVPPLAPENLRVLEPSRRGRVWGITDPGEHTLPRGRPGSWIRGLLPCPESDVWDARAPAPWTSTRTGRGGRGRRALKGQEGCEPHPTFASPCWRGSSSGLRRPERLETLSVETGNPG